MALHRTCRRCSSELKSILDYLYSEQLSFHNIFPSNNREEIQLVPLLAFQLHGPLGTNPEGPIVGFAIAGKDGKFQPAKADFPVTGKDSRGRPRRNTRRLVLTSPLFHRYVRYDVCACITSKLSGAVVSRPLERLVMHPL